ncbi:MAG: competence/damage-inducible protein A [Firmicutes bacterium]|nr:competence/damage-inducible protein A [Bacillota bacterium]
MRCEIISVGTELLMGQIINTNAQDIAQELFSLGIGVYYQTVVGDNAPRLSDVFTQALKRADLVILTGGLGPTDDDLTRETVAAVLGLPLKENSYWVQKLREIFARFKRPMAQMNLRQAMVPQGGKILPNERGTAPGIYLEDGGKVIVLLPGPPRELLPILKEQVIPLLREKLQEQKEIALLRSKVLRIAGLGESDMAEKIKPLLEKQDNPTIAPLAKRAEVHLRLTARGGSEEEVESLLTSKAEEIKDVLGEYIYGEDEDVLELAVARLLWEKGKTIALAESCSGGLLSHRLTNISGSSRYLLAGLVTYSNEAKINILGVKQAVIEDKGAVSAEVAEAMAKGVRRLCHADIGVSITGVAGPGGGSSQKPVGLTYIALEAENLSSCRRYEFWGSRQDIKERAAQTALLLLRLHLMGKLKK